MRVEANHPDLRAKQSVGKLAEFEGRRITVVPGAADDGEVIRATLEAAQHGVAASMYGSGSEVRTVWNTSDNPPRRHTVVSAGASGRDPMRWSATLDRFWQQSVYCCTSSVRLQGCRDERQGLRR